MPIKSSLTTSANAAVVRTLHSEYKMTFAIVAISLCCAFYASSITNKNNDLHWSWWLTCLVFPPALLSLIEKDQEGERKPAMKLAISAILITFSFSLPSLLKGNSMSERYTSFALDHAATALELLGTPIARTATTFEANEISFEFVANQSIFVFPAFLSVLALGTAILCANGKWIKPIIFFISFFLLGHILIVSSLTTGIYQVDSIEKMRSVSFKGIAEAFKATGLVILTLSTIGRAALKRENKGQNKSFHTTPAIAPR